ncbi:unnamed protein product [Effrenium voratum]|nr:unnamed protein product [Effrenium voratum]
MGFFKLLWALGQAATGRGHDLQWCGPACGDEEDQQVVGPEGRLLVRYPARPWEMLRYAIVAELLAEGDLTWPGFARIWAALPDDWATRIFTQVPLAATAECFPGHQFLRLAHDAHENAVPGSGPESRGAAESRWLCSARGEADSEREAVAAQLMQADQALLEAALCGGWPVFGLLALLGADREPAEPAEPREPQGGLLELRAEVRDVPELHEIMQQLKACKAPYRACLRRTGLQEVQRAQSMALLGLNACPQKSIMAWMDKLDPVPPIPLCVRTDSDLVSATIKRQGKWPECYELFGIVEATGAPQCLVLDVGANLGSCTMVLARSGYQALAFEPLPSSAALLRATLRFNENLKSAKGREISLTAVAQWAVGEPGEALVVEAYNNSGGSYVLSREDLDGCNRSSHSCDEGHSVHVVSLDQVLQSYGASKVCLLKIDTEGAELRVLRSAQAWLSRRAIQVIYFEWRPLKDLAKGEDPFQILEFLDALGYGIFASAAWFKEDEVQLPSVQEWTAVPRALWKDMLHWKGNLVASPK